MKSKSSLITGLLLVVISYSHLTGQIGGKSAYEFLSLPPSARLTALGGPLISVFDDDINLAASNPALLNSSMHNAISFSHNFHFADIQNGYVAYGRHIEKWKLSTHIGIQYMNYGDFKFADEIGNIQGTFSASETALTLGAGKKLNERIFVGCNVKAIFSGYESYNSIGLATDLGLSYTADSSDFVLSFVIKNLGGELSTFNETRFGAPLDVQIGISKKLKYLPFRFSITGHQLHRLNVRYDDPNIVQNTGLFGEPVKENKTSEAIDNVFRHLIFSGEFLLGKGENLRLRIGYNHFRRQELSLASFRSMAGFSTGFGMKIKGFRLDYGVAYHHLHGATNHISISTNFNRFTKKV
ncbi:MAG: type IX secretion system protein PorQ [Saprospiraceae bacterium]|nr:type IX secretion system protein PorQ [Saprospiraceae bacterium]